MPNIRFNHENKTVKADPGEWLYDVVQRANIGPPSHVKRVPAEHVQLKYSKEMII